MLGGNTKLCVTEGGYGRDWGTFPGFLSQGDVLRDTLKQKETESP